MFSLPPFASYRGLLVGFLFIAATLLILFYHIKINSQYPLLVPLMNGDNPYAGIKKQALDFSPEPACFVSYSFLPIYDAVVTVILPYGFSVLIW